MKGGLGSFGEFCCKLGSNRPWNGGGTGLQWAMGHGGAVSWVVRPLLNDGGTRGGGGRGGNWVGEMVGCMEHVGPQCYLVYPDLRGDGVGAHRDGVPQSSESPLVALLQAMA